MRRHSRIPAGATKQPSDQCRHSRPGSIFTTLKTYFLQRCWPDMCPSQAPSSRHPEGATLIGSSTVRGHSCRCLHFLFPFRSSYSAAHYCNIRSSHRNAFTCAHRSLRSQSSFPPPPLPDMFFFLLGLPRYFNAAAPPACLSPLIAEVGLRARGIPVYPGVSRCSCPHLTRTAAIR